MDVQEWALSHERKHALERSQWRQTCQATDVASDIRSLICAVNRSIPLDVIDLPDIFFPAHLPVALVEAVFDAGLQTVGQPDSFSERYCRHFGIARTRANRWEAPPVDEQESLGDLISHYDELGVDGMARNVFHARRGFPETRIVAKATYVLGVANVLRGIGVAVLQDVASRTPEAIDAALRPVLGNDNAIIRLLMMYSGNDHFVWGDIRVRNFVARAIGRRTVSAGRAVKLVRHCAYELILSPRYLDYQIWRCELSDTASPLPETEP